MKSFLIDLVLYLSMTLMLISCFNIVVSEKGSEHKHAVLLLVSILMFTVGATFRSHCN